VLSIRLSVGAGGAPKYLIFSGLRGGWEKGERRLVKIHKRLLYCVNVNRTSLDHLLLGKRADVDRACRIRSL